METKETLRIRINALQSENLGLQSVMAKSDAHAAKCAKLGLSFAEAYPADLAEYNAAADKFHANEAEIGRLSAELETAPDDEPESPDSPAVES